MDTKQVIYNRKSTALFKQEKVEREKILSIAKAGNYAGASRILCKV